MSTSWRPSMFIQVSLSSENDLLKKKAHQKVSLGKNWEKDFRCANLQNSLRFQEIVSAQRFLLIRAARKFNVKLNNAEFNEFHLIISKLFVEVPLTTVEELPATLANWTYYLLVVWLSNCSQTLWNRSERKQTPFSHFFLINRL